jgi:T5SS/PEP-CTERM-associated repeat protein
MRRVRLTLLAMGIVAVGALCGRADDVRFGVANGAFTAGSSWVGGNPPGIADRGLIDNNGTATLNGSADVGRLYLGSATGTSGNMTMSGGELNVVQSDLRVGDLGTGSFTLSGGTINHGSLVSSDGDINIGRSGTGTFTMTGGTINAGGSVRVARGASAVANATMTMSGNATVNAGDGIVVARGDTFGATGTFTIGGTASFISGNSRGDGNPLGSQTEGFFSVANLTNAVGHVLVKDSAVVKTLRFTGRQGHGDITIQDQAKFLVVNQLGGNVGGGASPLYNSYLGGGSDSNGNGSNGDTGVYTLAIKGSGLLDVDANAYRDLSRQEFQGFVLARGNSTATATVQDNATMVVRQRLVIGGLGAASDFTGFDGNSNPGLDPGGTGTLNVTGGLVSVDHLVVGGTGNGTLNASGGIVMTKPYNATYDLTIGAQDTSVDSIRIGFATGSIGVMNVSGTTQVTTGADLGIGQYGDGTLKVTGGTARIGAKDVFVQKFAGSTGKLIAEITGTNHTAIRATNDVHINGGTFAVVATAPPATGAHTWDILRANVDGDAVGALTGTFDTLAFPADDASGRTWSAYYTPLKFVLGLARPGDATYDSVVDFNDLVKLAQHYNGPGQWIDGDFTRDGQVDFNDLVKLAQNYNTAYPAGVPGASAAFQADVARAFASAPEPSAVCLLAMGACARLLQRRRQRAPVHV